MRSYFFFVDEVPDSAPTLSLIENRAQKERIESTTSLVYRLKLPKSEATEFVILSDYFLGAHLDRLLLSAYRSIRTGCDVYCEESGIVESAGTPLLHSHQQPFEEQPSPTSNKFPTQPMAPSVNSTVLDGRPELTPDYILRWGAAIAFLSLMIYLMIWSVYADSIWGILVSGIFGLWVIRAMVTSQSFLWIMGKSGSWLRSKGKVLHSFQRFVGKDRQGIDFQLHHLRGQHEEDAIAYLGIPDHIGDLSLRGGVLPDHEMHNLEYYSKGLRLFVRSDRTVESIHFIHRSFSLYETYPREILPGLRVGMPRQEIEALLGAPEPDEGQPRWRSYQVDAILPQPVQVTSYVEVFYETPGDLTAIAMIVAI